MKEALHIKRPFPGIGSIVIYNKILVNTEIVLYPVLIDGQMVNISIYNNDEWICKILDNNYASELKELIKRLIDSLPA